MSTDSTSTESQGTWKIPPAGSPCWYEIPTVDVASLKQFYSTLFPSWDWKAATESYPAERIAMFSFAAGPAGLTGGIVRVTPDCKTNAVELPNGHGTRLYHFVDSIEETQKQIEELGGKVSSGKQAEGENGFYMYCHDPQGNAFGIYELKKSTNPGSVVV